MPEDIFLSPRAQETQFFYAPRAKLQLQNHAQSKYFMVSLLNPTQRARACFPPNKFDKVLGVYKSLQKHARSTLSLQMTSIIFPRSQISPVARTIQIIVWTRANHALHHPSGNRF